MRLVAALVAEAAVGYPDAVTRRVGHPVTWLGSLIAAADQHLNHGSAARRRRSGELLLVSLVGVAAGMARLAERRGGAAMVVALATTGLAQRSLHDHVVAVLDPLAAGDLNSARLAVARIVGRDTANLDEAGIATAAIESLAESFCDGVVAPAAWFAVAGLPGLAMCKAVNTADSMIGHRDDRHRDFGRAAAVTDDAVNWLPARLAGLLVCLAGGGGAATMWREARRHASPNGGWPEAAMAGALGVRLGGSVTYDGEPADRAWLGNGRAPDASDLARALRIYRRACVLLWVLAWRR